MKNDFIEKYRAEIVLAGILLLSAFLNIWNLWNQGFSNTYYAAAVRSMLANPAVAFFSSFDAAGFITVDKPPVGLWVQAAFAAVLGYSNWALDLPQALAGVASVALVYFIVSRPFGKPAGLIASFALAITPIFVATARNETMDLQLILVILLAVWAALNAARKKSFWNLAFAMVLVGIGFNIKMIQAFIVVPAIIAVYIFGSAVPLRQKAVHLIAAVLILLIVSLSWAVAVDLIPADQRPYIGSSGDNTVFGLMFGHNGIERLESTGSGMSAGTPRSPSPSGNFSRGQPGEMMSGSAGSGSGAGNTTRSYGGPSASGQDIPLSGTGSRSSVVDTMDGSSGTRGSADQGRDLTGIAGSHYGTGNMTGQSGIMAASGQDPVQAANGGQPEGFGMSSPHGGGGGMGGQGAPGILMFYESDIAGQVSWLLPLALIGFLAWLKKPVSFSMKGLLNTGLSSEKGLTLMAIGLWLLPGLLYFSFTSGFWHTYYLATIAPPLAALVGIGIIGMYDAYRNEGAAGWLLVAAVLATGLLEVRILLYDAGFAGLLIPGVLAGTIIVAVFLVYLRKMGKQSSGKLPVAALLLTFAILFAAPFVWACTPMGYSGGDNLPTAGPQGGTSGGNWIQGGFSGQISGAGTMTGQPGNTLLVDQGFVQPVDAAPSSDTGNMTISGPARVQSGTRGQTGGTGMPSMQGGSRGMGSIDSSATGELAAYLLAHNNGETFLAATTGTHSAAGLIIVTGRPVMALGGFLGTDQPLTLEEFRDEVRNGAVRYFIASGGGSGMGGAGGNSAIASWVESSCVAVTDPDGSGSTSAALLFDCSEAV